MPEPTIKDLYKQLSQAETLTAAHVELNWAIEELERAAEAFRRFLGRKQLPRVKAADRENLMRLHREIGLKAEALLAGNDRPAVKELVRKLEALSAANYRALLEYDPAKKPLTLDSIEEGSRTLTLHLGPEENNAESWGGALSERRPLSFYDEKGNKISGLFTKKSELRILDSFQAALDEALAKTPPEKRDAAKAFFDHVRDSVSKPEVMRRIVNQPDFPFTEDPAHNICTLLKYIGTNVEDGKRVIDPMPFGIVLRKLLPREQQEDFDMDHATRLAEALTPRRSALVINHGTAKIPENSRLDNRNAAMSTVADLLGMPEVLARAKPMRLKLADGTEIEGTFMEQAKGLDLKNLSDQAQFVDEGSLEGTNGKGFRSLANLQVLDYLCGNVDRHAANLAYQFDKNHKFIGVQGFDNDASFGVFDLQDGKGHNRLTGTKHLVAVPRKTYERIMQLNPATLKYALRGYGLSEEELNAAGARLNTLKKDLRREKEYYENYDRTHRDRNLQEEHVRILEDNQWEDYEARDFYVSEKTNSNNEHRLMPNTFSLALSKIEGMSAQYARQEKAYKDLSKTIAVGIENRANASTPGREQKKSAALSQLLSKRTWWGFSSPQYRAMERAVKAYTDYQKQIDERLRKAGSEDAKRGARYEREREAVVTQADLERMRTLSANMKNAAQTYLDGKLVGGLIPDGASEYTKRRIAIAMQVASYGEQGSEIRQEERQQAERNEAQAGERSTRRRENLEADRSAARERELNR